MSQAFKPVLAPEASEQHLSCKARLLLYIDKDMVLEGPLQAVCWHIALHFGKGICVFVSQRGLIILDSKYMHRFF